MGPPDGGSLSVVYSCPECGYEMAMLTNAYETQIVQSLGVRIGPAPVKSDDAGGCPFAAMIQGTDDADRRPAAAPVPVPWTAAAEARLVKVPEFVRPMARAGIEKFAMEKGASEVDEQILDAAREFFGM
ncbi:MAG TPA: PCP reductase family protein [Vicinamibacterales bacterium]|nr:PCP reductase family protein [Vicinamibacterales bacterium]